MISEKPVILSSFLEDTSIGSMNDSFRIDGETIEEAMRLHLKKEMASELIDKKKIKSIEPLTDN